jgi:serine protease DegQ
MKRVAVYSSTPRSTPRSARGNTPGNTSRGTSRAGPVPAGEAPEVPREKPSSWKPFLQRNRRRLGMAAGVLAVVLIATAAWTFGPQLRGVSPAEVEAAIQRALEANPPRPTAADAYEKILPSVVHVRGLMTEADPEPAKPEEKKEENKEQKTVEDASADKAPAGNIGTGVVIVDTGIILTNLHVVNGAKRVKVTFFDGLESEAEVIGVRPEHDLAVLQAKKIPDDLFAATMRSTNGLRIGDEVVAVGFPFGIGPSASSGVISGLRREYRSEQGQRVLGNLIQFDAAVNPGNSGGPLVTTEGEVIGIVTGLLNPTEQRVFIGIGFAVPIENAAAAAGLSPF